jgi:aldose sugar dehydrogenase
MSRAHRHIGVPLFLRAMTMFCLFALLGACSSPPEGRPLTDRTSEFLVEQWASGLDLPAALSFLPDGSALVAQKGGFQGIGEGAVRHIRSTGELETILTLPVCAGFERGLVGIEVDPNFNENGYFYTYRTQDPAGECPDDNGPFSRRRGTATNRVSRFTWTGGMVDPSSEVVLVDGIRGSGPAHQGGALTFGPDGLLYVGVGGTSRDDDITIPSRDLHRPEGKILRISASPGSPIPADNPYLNNPTAHPLVWASGFRNPFTLGIHPVDGTVIAADVGSDRYEELNLVTRGGDYGWPQREGEVLGPVAGESKGTVSPIYAYDHSEGCTAVIAGDFLVGDRMGNRTDGRFAFTDFSCAKVMLLDYRRPDGELQLIANIEDGKSDIKVGPDGLVYVVGLDGTIWRVRPKG